MKITASILLGAICLLLPQSTSASVWTDRDNDGISDAAEVQLYGTNPDLAELVDFSRIRNKRIEVDLSDQRLQYFGDGKLLGSFLISSGLLRTPTPVGIFAVQFKRPTVHYQGVGYSFPNTKWNLQFKKSYYIHGAYWHNNFGYPMSHGCVNVAYKDMERLYAFADVGTPVLIRR